MERLTMTSNKGGVALAFDLNVICGKSEILKILKLAERLKHYEDLEEQGLLLKLLCKRGDTVYFIKSAFSIVAFPIDAKVTSINIVDYDNDVMYSAITNYSKIWRRFKSSDIGKTVFLTQTEAEEALKKMKGE